MLICNCQYSAAYPAQSIAANSKSTKDKSTKGKTTVIAKGTDGGKTMTKISSKAGRSSLVIAVIPAEKPAKVAAKTGAAPNCGEVRAGSKLAKFRSYKGKT